MRSHLLFGCALVALALMFTVPSYASASTARGNAMGNDLTEVYASVADIERQSDPLLGGDAVRLLARRSDGAGYKELVTTESGFKVEPRYNVQAGARVDTLVIYESDEVTREHLESAELFDVLNADDETFDRYERDAGTSAPRGATREYLIPLKLSRGDTTPINNDPDV